MSKCKLCRGQGEIETSPAAYERCNECGGTGNDEKPECPRCGREMYYDPHGIQGWLCEHCDPVDVHFPPGSHRQKWYKG